MAVWTPKLFNNKVIGTLTDLINHLLKWLIKLIFYKLPDLLFP